jgi:PmbA protein
MKVDERLDAVIERLNGDGFKEVEVYAKRGRSRSFRYTPRTITSTFHDEAGWAVRAGDDRRSFFYATTGIPDPDAAWPDADGEGLRLPPARLVPEWTPPADLDAPLVGESEAVALFENVGRELDGEFPGARLVFGQLDDGSSDADILSSREVRFTTRQRTAILHLEAAVVSSQAARRVTLRLAEREARHFQPLALARRLADRLLIAVKGSAPSRDRGEFLLAPPVVVAILDTLSSLWLGPEAEERVADLTDRRGRLASAALTLVDDGRLPGGVLETAVDGEGQPTRSVVLIDEGIFRQPLLAWWQTGATRSNRASGCSQRPSWRDLPRPGPTHLYLKQDPGNSVAALVGGLQRGYYLLDVEGAARLTRGGRRFAIPVCGFAIDGGRPSSTLSNAWLVGSISSFLNGIHAVARDLTFLPAHNGLIGSPSLLGRGLEIRRRTDGTYDD